MPPTAPPSSTHVAPDRAAVERAVADLLAALGHPPASDPELRETPARVARALTHELLDGYARDPAEVLRDSVEAREPGLVVLTGVRFASMCPHHLMPALGRADVGYLPGERVAGIGTLVALLETFAHRLILQETLGRTVAEALCTHLGARGAGVVLRARHTCLAARGERQAHALLVTTSLAGSFERDADDRALFLAAIARARPAR